MLAYLGGSTDVTEVGPSSELYDVGRRGDLRVAGPGELDGGGVEVAGAQPRFPLALHVHRIRTQVHAILLHTRTHMHQRESLEAAQHLLNGELSTADLSHSLGALTHSLLSSLIVQNLYCMHVRIISTCVFEITLKTDFGS